MATKRKTVKKQQAKVNKTWGQFKEVVKDVNEFALETSEEVVEGVITNGEKWQKVVEKATKGGLQLSAKQQDIVYNTLETVKGQLVNSTKRLKKIFSSN